VDWRRRKDDKKNWFTGANSPSGAHLVTLFRHSDAVLDACLRLAGRERILATGKLVEVGGKLRELLAVIETVAGERKSS
jgi:hypothetical protein